MISLSLFIISNPRHHPDHLLSCHRINNPCHHQPGHSDELGPEYYFNLHILYDLLEDYIRICFHHPLDQLKHGIFTKIFT